MSEPGIAGLGFDTGELPPPRRRRPGAALPALVALGGLLLVVVIIVAGVSGVHNLANLFGTPDYTGDGYGRVVVYVAPGDTATQIAQTLYHDGVVASVTAFTDAADANPRSRSIAPGYYVLHHHMHASAALALLLNPDAAFGRVIVPEGFTVTQILHRLTLKTHLSATALQAAIADPAALGIPAWGRDHLEGFCFPATYAIGPSSTATEAFAEMVAKFTQVTTQISFVAQARRLGYSPYDVLIIASIVQREGRRPQDLPGIARVFYNRLAANMPLGSDATSLYVVPPGDGSLTAADFDTSTKLGLPPTPIDNPGLAAINAALHPATGPWRYFTTIDKAGTTRFETSYAQHQHDAAIAHANGLQ
jgi:UPF0755 protein